MTHRHRILNMNIKFECETIPQILLSYEDELQQEEKTLIKDMVNSTLAYKREKLADDLLEWELF